MARLRKERARARLTHTPFDYPLRPYTRSLSDYFVRASESHAPSDGIIGGLSTTQEAELQRLVQQLQLSDGAPGPSASWDGAVPRDEYVDEMLAMSLSQTEEMAPPELASPFDLFGFEGASDLVDPPLTFDVLSGFVSRHDYVSDFSSMDLSTFEYLPVSHVIDLSAPSSPTSQIFDIDDEIAQHDSDDDSSSASDSDPVDQRVSPAVGDTEIVDFGTADQPRELRIGSDLSTDERDSLIQLLRSYLDVFAWSYEDMPGLDPSIVQHRLPLLPQADRLREVETIAPSLELAGERGDPEAAQCRILISDLNKASPKDDFPLPHIDMLVDSTAGHSMLSFMDGFSGYSQILMAPEDMEKTSFITEWGTYCYRVMPFGLKNAGATYQRAATTLFHDMMHRDVEVYVDDMIVKSRDRSDHLAALERFFERIRQFRLRLNPKKCTFGVTSGKLLGYMVSERGIEVDPDKIRAILDMPAPRTEREVRGFLGRLQYISRFIARLTDICEPIFRLLRKSQPTVWDDQCQRAFERIREYLLSPPVLAPPTPGRPLLLYLSVSDVALGCMLAQLDDSGKDRAIYYLSKRMLDYETRYVMIERYCLALTRLVGRLMRWLVLLTEFDIHYVTQKSIRGSIVADHLASLPVSDARAIDDDFPDEDVAAVTSLSGWRMYFDGAANHSGYGIGVLLISPHGDHIPRSMEVFGDSNLVLRQIQGEWKTRDVKLKPYHAYLELLVGRFDDLRYTHLPRAQNQFADALATLASMIDIPVDATPDDGLPWYHDIYHFLRLGVYPEAATAKDKRALRQLATDSSSWRDTCIDDHLMGCYYYVWTAPLPIGDEREVSRVSDTRRSHSRAALELHALTSPWPFSVWGIDIIGKISPKSSSGHEFILVAIDYFTKWVEAASYARLTSSGVASFIRSHIICRYGVPHELISDRGVHFRAEVDTLVQRYSIRHHRSSAYRPQTNGAVEAANKNIKRILRRMVETSRDWSEKLPFALWAYRTSFRTSTGATPYSLVYGMEAMLPVEIEMGSLRVALEQQIPEADWAQARFDQLNLLDERRLRAADHVRAYQRKMARAFKKRGVDPRGRCMVDGFRWKPILRANQCGSAKESITTFFTYSIVASFLSLLVIHLIPFTSYSPYSDPSRHSQVHGSWGSLYMLHFIYEGMSFDHWVFEPSFLSFLSPYHLGLRYVPCLKTTLRPWDQMSSSAASTWTGLIQLCSDYQDQVHGSSRTCATSLTGCSSRRGHDRLSYGASEIHPAGSALLDTWIPSCLSTGRSMFDLILSDYSEEPLLSHSARFIPFDIVVWSCLWCLDFPRHHFKGMRSVTRPIGVILGSSGQIGYIGCHTGGIFSISDEIYGSSLMSHDRG
ncbi:Retrovirus-related Pol polyprotein from transposon 17.6 [Vitis vinifera]|uniref:Retrovirus-related Pol polyprotein from transposon 17.6 n=1 Tax=Vitis vinifera TaxID=29760 RepID=A0A438G2Q6_VITVI|nr:Retrovirus-related Pol polyprotein from transposon 17.6 [Vitis vinifera]